MTVAEQQALYEQTRARIQSHLDEITHLANNSHDPRLFFSEYVKKLSNSLTAQGVVVWQGHSQGFERVAEENFASCEFDSNPVQHAGITKILSEMANTRKQYIIDAGNSQWEQAAAENKDAIVNVTPFPYFFIPVCLGTRLVMVLQVWLKEKGDAKGYQDICAFLANWASIAATFLRNHQGAVAAVKNEELHFLVLMQANLLGEHNPKEVAAIVSNYTSDLIKADLACVFTRYHKGWKLLSASNQEAIDDRSVHVQALIRAGAELASSATPVSQEINETTAPEALKEALEAISYTQVLYRLVGKTGTDLGDYLICAFKHSGEKFSPYNAETLNKVADATGKSLEASLHHHRVPFRPLVDAISRINRYWQVHPRRKVATYGGILALLLIILFLVPYPLRVTAECTVMPYEKFNAVAETAGKVIAVYVEDGQYVVKNQVLAKLEDQDLNAQLAISKLESERWKLESGRAQLAKMDAERKLADLNSERELQTAKRLEYLIAKTEIVAPHDGIVLTHNLHNREGEKLELGAPFCEIAGRESYDVILDIKQQDIGDLLRALQKNGRLPVAFILHSHSQQYVTASIEGMQSVSEVAQLRKSGSVFAVRAEFPKNSPLKNELKAGLTGIAKVRIGTSNMAYSLFRPFLNYWRVNWGT
ncbi:MAG: biotin/lipoyl-binding protein [Chthoniobacterales bacterium]